MKEIMENVFTGKVDIFETEDIDFALQLDENGWITVGYDWSDSEDTSMILPAPLV